MEATATNTELAVITEKSGLEKKTTDEIAKKFSQFFTIAKEWKQKIEALEITSAEQKAEMKMARDARLFLKNTRVLAQKDTEIMRLTIKERMAKDVAEDKFVVECFRLVETAFKSIEKIAQDKEDFAEKLEQERKDKLKAERIEILTPLSEFVPMGLNLAEMSEDDFSKLVNGANLQKEAKEQADKKAQQEAIERENAVKLYNSRKEILLPYWNFLRGDQASIDFSALSYEDFDIIYNECIKAKSEHDKQFEELKLAAQKLEEEKAKAQAEIIEANRLAKLKADNRVEFLLKNGYYNRANGCFSKKATEQSVPFDVTYEKLLSLTDEEFSSRFNEVEALIKRDAELAEASRVAKEELKAKEDAEEKAKLEEEARLEAELNKGDADKFNDLIADLKLITTKYNFKSKKNQKIYADVVTLVNKTIEYANTKKI